MKKIFYEKVGSRYKPVSEYDSDLLDSMPKGTHIIMCYPGGRSTRYNIDPALAPMIAAGRYAERKIADAIHEASMYRPKKKPVTEEQRLAWENLKAAYNDDMFSIQSAAISDVAEAGVKAMQEEAQKLLTNPAVQKAYDHFMLMCKLAKEEECSE